MAGAWTTICSSSLEGGQRAAETYLRQLAEAGLRRVADRGLPWPGRHGRAGSMADAAACFVRRRGEHAVEGHPGRADPRRRPAGTMPTSTAADLHTAITVRSGWDCEAQARRAVQHHDRAVRQPVSAIQAMRVTPIGRALPASGQRPRAVGAAPDVAGARQERGGDHRGDAHVLATGRVEHDLRSPGRGRIICRTTSCGRRMICGLATRSVRGPLEMAERSWRGVVQLSPTQDEDGS